MAKLTAMGDKQLRSRAFMVYRDKIGGDEDDRREMLMELYDVDSFTKLDKSRLISFIISLLSGRRPERMPMKNGKATKKQIWRIEESWRNNGAVRDHSDMALRNFINRIIKRRPLHLEDMSEAEATKVIIAIEKLT